MTKEELDRVYEYLEPDSSGGTIHTRVTARLAIEIMRQYAKSRFSDRTDHTDEELLEAFVLIYWAYPVKEEPNND